MNILLQTQSDHPVMLFVFQTKAGPFYIGYHRRRFYAIYNHENLGWYTTANQAAEDLSGGHTFSPSNGVDTDTLGIPDDVSEWECLVKWERIQ